MLDAVDDRAKQNLLPFRAATFFHSAPLQNDEPAVSFADPKGWTLKSIQLCILLGIHRCSAHAFFFYSFLELKYLGVARSPLEGKRSSGRS